MSVPLDADGVDQLASDVEGAERAVVGSAVRERGGPHLDLLDVGDDLRLETRPEGRLLGGNLSAMVEAKTPEEQAERWKARVKDVPLKEAPTPRAVLYKPEYDGLFEGSLGMSKNYQEPVWNMILDRMPVSIFYGLITMFLVYGICLPLGILKAIKHRTWIDNASSVVVFFGYAIPGYALGSLLVVFLGARLGLFPLGGFTGEAFPNLDTWGKIKDLANHAVMPLICYMVGAFAFLTQIMKNNLMDNLAADYVRTAVAKGVGFRQAVFRHAFRNSIIPVATTFGSNITMLVSGSILIEKVFDINGFGLLQFNSLLERDQYLVMGLITVSAVLMLLGNVISDLCVALVDPRVSYN
jgi:microcin C transport system permease protein